MSCAKKKLFLFDIYAAAEQAGVKITNIFGSKAINFDAFNGRKEHLAKMGKSMTLSTKAVAENWSKISSEMLLKQNNIFYAIYWMPAPLSIL